MDHAEFRRLGHALVDFVADYREHLAALPVMSRARPGEIRALFPKAPPEHPQGLDDVVERLRKEVLPGLTHWNHPSFFAYFPSNTSYPSILADLVVSGFGAQGMSWQTSPAATEIEEVVMDWLRQLLGLSEAFTGVIHDTASTATLCALLCARERTSHFSQNGAGLQSSDGPLVVYASAEAHASIPKAALLAGFGRDHLRLLPTDDAFALRVDGLEAAIVADLAAGRRPCAIVAASGTTATTAFDPIERIAALAQRHGLWLHVDAAMAGTAMLLPECRPLWRGVESADSLVLNPHKWMGVGFDFSAYYVRDPEHLVRVMSTNPHYLRTAQDGEVRNLRDWGIPLGRRFRALKLLYVLRDLGAEGLRARLRRDLENARWLAAEIDRTPPWRRTAPTSLQTICARYEPPGLAPEAVDALNQELARRINEAGRAYLTPTLSRGRAILRVSIGAEATLRQHVEALWRELRETAASLGT